MCFAPPGIQKAATHCLTPHALARNAAFSRIAAPLAMGFALVGCGGTGSTSLDTWHEIVLHEWSQVPGTEGGGNIPITLDRDYVVIGIRGVSPAGTHHITLERQGAVHDVLWAAALGPGEFLFPEGIGLRLRKGELIYMGLHLFNASQEELSGSSGIEVIEADAAAHIEEANILNATIRNFSLSPGANSLSGKCTITKDQTIFAVSPHMHEFGKHIKTTVVQDGVEKPLFEQDVNWTSQLFVSIPEVQVHEGDVVNLDCDWLNTTTKTLSSGSEATQEMCSAFIYRYPEGDSGYCME